MVIALAAISAARQSTSAAPLGCGKSGARCQSTIERNSGVRKHQIGEHKYQRSEHELDANWRFSAARQCFYHACQVDAGRPANGVVLVIDDVPCSQRLNLRSRYAAAHR